MGDVAECLRKALEDPRVLAVRASRLGNAVEDPCPFSETARAGIASLSNDRNLEAGAMFHDLGLSAVSVSIVRRRTEGG